jgi:translation initiation factor IF-2
MENEMSSTITSKKSEIVKELRRLAVKRRAEISKEDLEIYTEELMYFDLEDVQEALLIMGDEEMNNFSKRWPEIGYFKRMIEKYAKLRRTSNSAIAGCQNRKCIQGMVRVVNSKGFCTGVIACALCGGPAWFKASLEHNFYLLKEKGLA